MNVSDLLSPPSASSSSSESESESESESISNKRSRSDSIEEPQEVSVPTLSSLVGQLPDRDALYTHLATFPKAILISMLLAEAKNSLPALEAESYGPSNNLAHCVYCHKLFDKTAPKYDCKVKHFGELDSTDDRNYDTRAWSCCGLVVDGYADYWVDGCHPPPEEGVSQYCWEGKHFDKLLEEEADAGVPGTWWKEWEENGGQTCEYLRCYNKPNGGHLDKRAKLE